MKKIFTKLMTIITAIALALFLVLGIIVIIVGPEKTENSIKALFNIDNYIKDYKEILPFLGNSDNNNDINLNQKQVLSVFNRRKIESITNNPPLIVPTTGVVPTNFSLYSGPIEEGKHEGINIWTNYNGTGMDGKTYNKGNPVYAACDGTVRQVWDDNGDVSIICDELDPIYKKILPSLKIKTIYGHMANKANADVYIYVEEGQRVKQGDLIGNQGNRCYWSPQNIMVTVHFGIYDISVAPQVPLDPSPYIGVSCTTLNQTFTAGIEESSI